MLITHAKLSLLTFIYIWHAELQLHLHLCIYKKTPHIGLNAMHCQKLIKICFSLTFIVKCGNSTATCYPSMIDSMHLVINLFLLGFLLWWVTVLMKTSAKNFKHFHLKAKLLRTPYKAVNQHSFFTGCNDQCMVRILKTLEDCKLGRTDQTVLL